MRGLEDDVYMMQALVGISVIQLTETFHIFMHGVFDSTI